MRLTRVSSARGGVTILHAYDGFHCGVINCAAWVLDGHGHTLLRGLSPWQIVVLATRHEDLPDLEFSFHDSAAETQRLRFRFGGSRYQLHSCETRTAATKVTAAHVDRNTCNVGIRPLRRSATWTNLQRP